MTLGLVPLIILVLSLATQKKAKEKKKTGQHFLKQNCPPIIALNTW